MRRQTDDRRTAVLLGAPDHPWMAAAGPLPHLWHHLEGQAPVVVQLHERQDAYVGSQAGDEVDGEQAAGDRWKRPIPVGGIAGEGRAGAGESVQGR